ncbi:MAG: LPS-assembly protein LptD, partial [Bacteroidota bacterium]|nr:LPS-assembly protein LptD [Bacteroidota bacterium]
KERSGDKPKTSPVGTQDELDYINTHREAYVDFNVPWSLNIYYNLNYSKPGIAQTVTQSVTFNGDLSLTKKWKISVTSGYDLTREEFTLTSINVYRDLHCWEMRFNWVPFGFRQSFSVDINVKSSVLRDLKLSRRKDWYDYQ